MFQIFLFMKSKIFLQIAIYVTIEMPNKNIDDIIFKFFAKILIKFNTWLQISQCL